MGSRRSRSLHGKASQGPSADAALLMIVCKLWRINTKSCKIYDFLRFIDIRTLFEVNENNEDLENHVYDACCLLPRLLQQRR